MAAPDCPDWQALAVRLRREITEIRAGLRWNLIPLEAPTWKVGVRPAGGQRLTATVGATAKYL